jgi:ATP-dependent DNA ligase
MFDAHNPLGRVELFEERLEAGDEGIMFKDEDGTYEMGKRVKHILKLKRFQTIDAVVMGWEPASEDKGWAGLVGAFKMGCYDSEGKLIEVANCSSMPLELRKQATDPETHGLRQEFYGLVAEVRFQQMTTRSFRGRHAVMVKWRTDKEARACLLDQVKEAPSEVMEGAF